MNGSEGLTFLPDRSIGDVEAKAAVEWFDGEGFGGGELELYGTFALEVEAARASVGPWSRAFSELFFDGGTRSADEFLLVDFRRRKFTDDKWRISVTSRSDVWLRGEDPRVGEGADENLRRLGGLFHGILDAVRPRILSCTLNLKGSVYRDHGEELRRVIPEVNPQPW